MSETTSEIVLAAVEAWGEQHANQVNDILIILGSINKRLGTLETGQEALAAQVTTLRNTQVNTMFQAAKVGTNIADRLEALEKKDAKDN